jgi:serine/threonine protein kinase/WD40 repeat protein
MADPSGIRYVLLNQLADEFAVRRRNGERPRIEEYCDRHPHLADDIQSLFPALVELERARADAGPELAVDVADAPSVTQLGDFRLLREVGRGGMGVVFEAEQVSLGRRVAIKLLPASVFRDPTKRRRFEREAKAAAKLHHTNIVPVHGFGEHDGTPYYVMQFIPGLGLDSVIDELAQLPAGGRTPELSQPPSSEQAALSVTLARGLLAADMPGIFGWNGPAADALTMTSGGEITPGPGPLARPDRGSSVSISTSGVLLPGQPGSGVGGSTAKKTTYWESVARIGVQVAGALAYAHKLGVLHRDIKPANLLLDLDGIVWVTDFGLAKADDSDDLTHTGDLLGTLRYMPPEAFEGKFDARSDVYGLGLTLFELVALRPAYEERDRNKLIKQVTTGDPPRLRKLRKDAPRDLVTVVEKAIDKDLARRYQSAGALADDLQRFLNDEPIQARQQTQLERCVRWARHHPGIAVLGGVLIAVLVMVTVASLLAAGHFNRVRLDEARAAQNERDARHEAELLRQSESSQRQRAEKEKKRADITLADMYTSRGLLAGERDAPAEAALWFAAAAEQSATAEDPQRQEDNRLRARNWMRQATLPVAAMPLSGGAHQLDFQPRGDLLLVRSGKGEVIFWSWRDGQRLPWAEGLTDVGSAQFSPDGAWVALGFRSGGAQIRNVANGELLATIGHQGYIGALAFSPDGKFLAVASTLARIWDIKGQAFLDPVWSHPQGVTGITFNRNGDRVITTCLDKRARVFAVEGRPDRNSPLYAPLVHAVASQPALIDEDRILVTVSGGSELTRWDMATGKPASAPTRTRPYNLQGVVASPDGRWFATGGYNGPELFAADAKRPPVHLGHTNLVRKLVFSPDSTMLLSVSWDQTARLWSLPEGQSLGQPLRHMANAECCAWSQDARFLATAQNDGLLRVWERNVDDSVIAREAGWGQRPRVSFDGRLVAPGLWHESAMGGLHQSINRLRVLTAGDGKPAGADIALPGALVDSCICGDNLAVAAIWSRGEKGQLGVWDVATATVRVEPITLPGLPISVAARPGSGQLAVLCATGDLLVVDDRTGTGVLKLRHEGWAAIPPGRNVQVQYTHDGKTLVSLGGVAPHTVNVRDADTGQLRFTPLPSSVPGSNFHSFSLSPDGRLLATMALVKNAVQVWDLATGRALSEPLPHPGDHWGLFSVRFSPDGQRVVTSHKDGQVRYWDWQAGKLACPPMAHDNETHDAVVTPDGRFALTVTGGRPEVHVWELTTGRRVAPPVRVGIREAGWCLSLAVTPDGQRALSVSSSTSGMGNDLAVVDLKTLLSPSNTSTADLALLAELATARRIELGDLSGLTTDQWLERWSLLRGRHPDLARSFIIGPNTAKK